MCAWGWEHNTAHFFQWKTKARDGINFWAQKERRWDNYKLTQQNICCLSSDAPALRFEWVENLCVSVFCGCQGGLRWNLFLLWWSCALYVTTDTVNRVLLLAWWENRDQSPRGSYNQLMSIFHLCRCSHTLHSHSILEFSDSGFCSTFYRRGKWDLGRSKDLLVMVAPACYLLSPQICCSRDREVRTSSAERYCCAS